MEALLKTAEVAHLLRISSRTVRLRAECGELPGIKIGRQWRFRSEKLDSLLGLQRLAALAAYKRK